MSSADMDEDDGQFAHEFGERSGSSEPNDDPSNKKRHRLRPDQTRRLMEVFQKTTKPDSEMRKVLGKQLDMTPRTVQIWFQNRRAKIKRESNATSPLRLPGFFGSPTYANRGRLAFNREFVNHRPTSRVASEGFGHLRGSRGFEPYPRQDLAHSLTLQNPSQVSIPMDVQTNFSLQTLRNRGALSIGQSAIGVPAAPERSRTFSGFMPGRPDISSASMDHILGNMFTMGTSEHMTFPNINHAAMGDFSGLSSAIPMSSQSGVDSTMALQLQSSQNEHVFWQNHANQEPVGRLMAENNAYVPTPTAGSSDSLDSSHMSGQAAGSQQSHQLSQPRNSCLPLTSSSDVPTAGALLESRRRHLQDLMIINQTHAARSLCAGSLPSGHVSMQNNVSDTSHGTCRPLPFSDLANHPDHSADALASPMNSFGGHGHGGDYSCQISSMQGSTQYSATSSSAPVSQRFTSNTSSADNDSSSIDGVLAGSAPSNASESNDMATGSHQATQHALSAVADRQRQPASLTLSLGCSTDQVENSQYQILNDLLMQCNAFELLAGNDKLCQSEEHPLSDSSEQPLSSSIQLNATPMGIGTDCTDLQSNIGAASLQPGCFNESFFAGNNMIANAVAAVYMNVSCAGSTAPTGYSSSTKDSDNYPLGNSSFMTASASPATSPEHYAHDMGGSAPVAFHAPISDMDSLQSKQDSTNQISVAPSTLAGQRDYTIEQIYYSSAQF
ncbi:hypothetical protein LPJ66_002396 [Kickxella alabastrina]|uniref:Uncharacterized protein n=1 Tax=Kickxella alabastrina TaxID=61397 RepID=A0ACC1IQH5_9FUNG|nr:hypothetical protein LPJ66_002396 [Kickxella alabastrina]